MTTVDAIEAALRVRRVYEAAPARRRALAQRLSAEGFDPGEQLTRLLRDLSGRDRVAVLVQVLTADPDPDGVPRWRARLDAIAAEAADDKARGLDRLDSGPELTRRRDTERVFEAEREHLGMSETEFRRQRFERALVDALSRAGKDSPLEQQIASDAGMTVAQAREVAARWEQQELERPARSPEKYPARDGPLSRSNGGPDGRQKEEGDGNVADHGRPG